MNTLGYWALFRLRRDDRPRLNTDVVNGFLPEFSQTLAADEQAVIIWDGVGFHNSKKFLVPKNITLVQLPPYSSRLNLMENLWNYLKSHS